MTDKSVVLAAEVEERTNEDSVAESGPTGRAGARVRDGVKLDRKAPLGPRLRMVLMLSLASWALVLMIVLSVMD